MYIKIWPGKNSKYEKNAFLDKYRPFIKIIIVIKKALLASLFLSQLYKQPVEITTAIGSIPPVNDARSFHNVMNIYIIYALLFRQPPK